MQRILLSSLLVASLIANVYQYQGSRAVKEATGSKTDLIHELISSDSVLQKTILREDDQSSGIAYTWNGYAFTFLRQQTNGGPLMAAETAYPNQTGVVIMDDDGKTTPLFDWLKHVEEEDRSGMGPSNPVALFVDGGALYVDMSDEQGAGSGEGALLRLKTTDGKMWEVAGCYYLVPEVEAIDPWGLSPSPDCVTDTEEEVEAVEKPTIDHMQAENVARVYWTALAYGWYDQAAELYQSAEGVEQLRGYANATNRQDLSSLFEAACMKGMTCAPLVRLTREGSGDGWVSFRGFIGTDDHRTPIAVTVERVGWFDDQPLWRVTSTPRDLFFLNQE